ncbi:MAG: GtrA family protein [Minisyncoccia bacterium]
MITHLLRVTRFVVSGIVAAGVNLAIFHVLTSMVGLWYLYAVVVAFLISFFVSFLLQKLWTFKDGSSETIHKQVASFFLLQFSNMFLNITGVFVLVEYAGFWSIAAQFITLLILAVETFLISHWFIFSSSKTAR